MRPNGNGRVPLYLWLVLWIAALTIRLWGAWHFPTAEQDGYSDAETIARLSAEIVGGTFRLSHLYGFWLPLFQLVAAIPNIWLQNPLLAGSVISALCGAAACVLTFAISFRLAHSVSLAVLAFMIVLLSPVHLLYSSACMTDVPFGCLLLASLLFVLRDQWTAAMITAAIAGGVRVEAWTLIPLLPLLQFLKERRVSVPGVLVLLAPPLLWLVISYLARGDWLAFFNDRVVYHERYMDFYPSRRGFTFADVRYDLDLLMFGANRAIFIGALLAGLIVLFRVARHKPGAWPALATLSCFAAILAFLILGYVTKRQPVWLPRYGLFALVLGTPLLMWLLRLLFESSRPRWLAAAGVLVAILLCGSEARSQCSILPKVFSDFRAHSTIARALQNSMQQTNDTNDRCFSDDVAVRVLCRLPREKILRSHDAPPESWKSGAVFNQFLRDRNVRYLVFMATEDSLPAKWLPVSGDSSAAAANGFEQMMSAKSGFGPDVVLFRVTR